MSTRGEFHSTETELKSLARTLPAPGAVFNEIR
jgi:hypothetical protein